MPAPLPTKSLPALGLGVFATCFCLAAQLKAGPYAPAAGQPTSTAIAATDPRIISWANGFSSLTRGWQDASDTSLGRTTYGSATSALGPSNATPDYPYDDPNAPAPVVSLGDGGSITLTFTSKIGNGNGPDFVVFENGFDHTFLELAHVEVSSNGTNFFRFPSHSLTPTVTQVGAFGRLDPTNLHNLAGKYRAGFGTPFDLQDLAGIDARLNVNQVTHVRIIDVVGSLQSAYATRDSQNRIINDPWATPYDTGGFDLDAVGVLNPGTTPWQSWRSSQFSAAQLADQSISGPEADPDGDGRKNLAEYALNSAPLSPNGGAPLQIDWNTGPRLRFARIASLTDVTYTLQAASTPGGPWTPLARSTGGATTVNLASASGVSLVESGSGSILVTVGVPSTHAARYFRLHISLTTP